MNGALLATWAAFVAAGAGAAEARHPAPAGPVAAARPASPELVPAAPSVAPEPRARHGGARAQRRSARTLVGVSAANRAALREPIGAGFSGAVQVYPWVEGALYRLYTAPEQVSDIALQAGEALVSVAAGDTVRWVIGDTTSGAGASRRVHVLVKPSAAGLSTNLLVATDRRVYHIEVASSTAGAMASIAWSYPEDALLAVRREQAAADAMPVAEGLEVDRLNFDYGIEGDRPSWRPVRAFDDGRQVFIEFPAGLATGDAPPLFLRGEKGAAELVNYRLRGRYYVVDRLFGSAELRLGSGKKQVVVRIVRGGRAAGRKARGSAS
jgi:P-type conjugative transfer protein TrbG